MINYGVDPFPHSPLTELQQDYFCQMLTQQKEYNVKPYSNLKHEKTFPAPLDWEEQSFSSSASDESVQQTSLSPPGSPYSYFSTTANPIQQQRDSYFPTTPKPIQQQRHKPIPTGSPYSYFPTTAKPIQQQRHKPTPPGSPYSYFSTTAKPTQQQRHKPIQQQRHQPIQQQRHKDLYSLIGYQASSPVPRQQRRLQHPHTVEPTFAESWPRDNAYNIYEGLAQKHVKHTVTKISHLDAMDALELRTNGIRAAEFPKKLIRNCDIKSLFNLFLDFELLENFHVKSELPNLLCFKSCSPKKKMKRKMTFIKGNRSRSETGYFGVRMSTSGYRFRATVNYNGKPYNAGTFKTVEEAARKYDEKLIELTNSDIQPGRLNLPNLWKKQLRKTKLGGVKRKREEEDGELITKIELDELYTEDEEDMQVRRRYLKRQTVRRTRF